MFKVNFVFKKPKLSYFNNNNCVREKCTAIKFFKTWVGKLCIKLNGNVPRIYIYYTFSMYNIIYEIILRRTIWLKKTDENVLYLTKWYTITHE